MRVPVVCHVAAVLSSVVAAQSPIFHGGVELVNVPVTVQHKDPARVLPLLAAVDVRILEDGRPQKVALFERDLRPVSLAIVLDSSSSVGGEARRLSRDAIHQIFAGLAPQDEVALVAFGDYPITVVHWTSVGTTPGLDWAQWVLKDESAVVDGVSMALSLMDTASHPRRVIVIVSDGLDNASRVGLADLARSRNQSEVAVYALNTFTPRIPPGQVYSPLIRPPQTHVLAQLIGESGGMQYLTWTDDTLAAAILACFSDLRSQYLVGYEPLRPLDGKYRRIKVEATNKDHVVRHRSGYLALPTTR